MPSSTLIPFLGGLGSLLNPLKQKKGTLFKPRLLGSLVGGFQGFYRGFSAFFGGLNPKPEVTLGRQNPEPGTLPKSGRVGLVPPTPCPV